MHTLGLLQDTEAPIEMPNGMELFDLFFPHFNCVSIGGTTRAGFGGAWLEDAPRPVSHWQAFRGGCQLQGKQAVTVRPQH